ncbi:hypothetical protein ACIG5E_15050 [Kitasatospora sp. NPDC053057]|uniref:terpene synthase family protein n=1 Tax=Kitasatospora sp. NPDC053057 TaxID=3364062 RepID=UPI0037C84689
MGSASTDTESRLDGAADRALAWARETGMLDPVFGLWDEKDLAGLDLSPVRSSLAASATAARSGRRTPGVIPEFDLAMAWYVWSRFADDFFATRYAASRDADGAAAFLARLLGFVPHGVVEPELRPINPLERGLADLWSRSTTLASPDWRHRIRAELHNLAGTLPAQLADLVERRAALAPDDPGAVRLVWSSRLTDHLAELSASPELARARQVLSGAADPWQSAATAGHRLAGGIGTQAWFPAPDLAERSTPERVARLAARVAGCFDDAGAYRERCDSRVTESTMLLALLRRERLMPGVQERLSRFLAQRRRDRRSTRSNGAWPTSASAPWEKRPIRPNCWADSTTSVPTASA